MDQEIDFQHLRRLWTLSRVVESGSIRAAAQKSKVSVSAVSQTISQLENELGQQLLIRNNGRVVPNSLCLELLSSCSDSFAALKKIGQITNTPMCLPKMSWLSFGTTESFAVDLVPGLIQNLRSALPKMRLTVSLGTSSDLIQKVKSGKLCMALVADCDDIESVNKILIGRDRIGVFISARPEISRQGWNAIDSLGLATLASEGSGRPLYYSKFMRKLELSTRPILTSDGYEPLRSAAAGGVVAAVLPYRIAMRTPGELVEVSPGGTDLSPDLGEYKVFLITEPACDPAEDEFLARQLKSLFHQVPGAV